MWTCLVPTRSQTSWYRSIPLVVIKMLFAKRIKRLRTGSLWPSTYSFQLRSTDGYACSRGGRLPPLLLRAAPQTRSGGPCSSSATRRVQAEADPSQIAPPRSAVLDCAPSTVVRLDRGPDHRETGDGSFLASRRISAVLAIAVEVPPTGTTEGQHTINMTRKGQVRWVSGTNVRRQFQYINQLVDLAV